MAKKSVNLMLGDNTTFEFKGNGFVQKGYVKCTDEDYVAKVEMYIDGALIETVNLPIAKSTSIDNRRVDLFHRYQLEDKEHKVSFKWLNPRSDAHVYLGETLIYASQLQSMNVLN